LGYSQLIHTHPARRFIGENYQTVTTFATESMDQSPRILMCQAAAFTASIA
jgi:hypothetical protein